VRETEDTISVAPATTPGTTTTKKVRASKSAKPAGRKASKAPSKKRVAKSAIKKAARPAAKGAVRPNTKKTIVLELLRRKQGATTAEIAKATSLVQTTYRLVTNCFMRTEHSITLGFAK
jgi:hypothetical protein